MAKVMQEKDLIQCTVYYKYYLFEAIFKAGLGNAYLDGLKAWKDINNIGLTTFAERPVPTRSDCHAWSASPQLGFLNIVLGVRPASPGFEEVQVRPNPGKLTKLEGTIATIQGKIHIHLKLKSSKWKGTIELPVGVVGDFELGNQRSILKSGINIID